MKEWGYCTSCNGSGEGMFDGTTCYACRGKGEVVIEVDDDEDDDDEHEDAEDGQETLDE